MAVVTACESRTLLERVNAMFRARRHRATADRADAGRVAVDSSYRYPLDIV